MQIPCDLQSRTFVVVVHADQDRAIQGQAHAGCDLRFGKGVTKMRGVPHDLTGRAHLGAQQAGRTGQFLERQDCLLDEEPVDAWLFGDSQLAQRFPGHDLGGDISHVQTGRFTGIGNGS